VPRRWRPSRLERTVLAGEGIERDTWALAPTTSYAKSGPYSIAYQVVGEGDLDLLWIPGWVSNVELAWEEPLLARFLSRLASFSRLILFDKRGTGLSDRVPEEALPMLEERVDDMLAVLDAAGSERAGVFGNSEGGNLAVLFAVAHPDRTSALVTSGIFAKRIWSPDYPWAPKPDERQRYLATVAANWGKDADAAHLAPSAAHDQAFAARLATYFRRSASPGAAAALLRMNTEIDIRGVLPAIRVPTLVLHRTGDLDAHVEEGRWIANQIPGARFVELPGEDHLPWVGDQDRLLDEVEQFLTGQRPVPRTDRVLATVLVTDIVGSTQRAVAIGDHDWSDLLQRHRAAVRRQLDRFGGREIDTAGDGFLLTFAGPGRAIRAAAAIIEAVRPLGIEVRCGVHTGECELLDDGIGGVAVHVAARVAGLAGASEILVTRTVTDLVAGSGISFAPRGEQALKGFPEPQALFVVESV
jgi:pimeloyl-ACP methyl ester carboxylesterase